MAERLICLLTGYLLGTFLTADAVARWRTGMGAGSLGSGNPGMANIAGSLGAGWGALVLAGDVGKTALACGLCRWVLCPNLGQTAVLWAGLGAVLGHNFPAWRRFRGGKGVAVTCTCLILAQPVLGVVSCLAGLGVVLGTGYLPVGAVVIPVAFLVPALVLLGPEEGAWAAVLTAVMLSRHRHGLSRVLRGEEERHLRRRTG